MRIRRVLFACAIVGLLQSPTAVLAQYNNSGSPYGTSSPGTSTGRQGMFGNRTVGGSGIKSSQGTFGSTNPFGSQGDLSSARFVRGNRQAGDFVGGDAQNKEHFVGGVQNDMTTGNYPQSGWPMSSTTPGGGYPSSRQNPNRNQRESEETAGQNAAAIRTTFHVAFNHPQPNSNRLSTSLTRWLAGTPAIQTQTPIRVELQGRTAILRGAVSTDHDRLLAENMIRLEPGIEAVKNEIAVENPTPTEPMLPELTPP